MYILLIWNTILLNLVFLTWYQSHCSNLSLSSLVSLVVTPLSSLPLNNSHCSHSLLNLRRLSAVVLGFRAYSRRRWGVPHHTNHYTYRLHCVSCSDNYSIGTIVIASPRSTQPWKSRSHWSSYAPSYAAQRSCASVTHLTHRPLFLLMSSLTSLLPRQPYLTSSLPHHHPFICWCHLPLQLTSSLLTIDQRWFWPLTSVDFDRMLTWSLTFLHRWLLQSRFSLPSFSSRFHFCSLFLHILSLNG